MDDEEEKINLKSEETKKVKKVIKYDFFYIIIILFLLIIICAQYISNQICYSKISSNKNTKGKKKEGKNKIYQTKVDKHKNNSHNFLVLMPGKNCPNQNLKTLFLKRKYYNNTYQKFYEKNIILSSFNYYDQTFYTESKNEFREQKLKELGLKLNKEMDVHNLYILPYYVSQELRKNIKNHTINKYQKINRFFNYIDYVSKSLIYQNYKKMNDIFPSEYDYMLETYSYPEEKNIIYEKFKNYTFDNSPKDNLWLIKPKLGSYGDNISLLKNITNIKNECLITKFLNNPHLIKGYKYDLRIHGLVTSIKPLKIYLYDEGLIRVSTEKYDSNNQSSEFSFITNLKLNLKNKKKFKYPKNFANIEESNLWNLAAFEKYCLRNGIDYKKLYEEFGDIFIKMIFSVRKKIIESIKAYNLSSSNFYHLIGFDILLDENLKPYLLEANRRCGFRDDNDAEKYYTHNIIADTINLVGIRILNKENNNIYDGIKYKDNLKEIIDDSLCELDRPRGEYKLIFPLKNNIEKYKKFYLKDIPKEDRLLWKNLKEFL